MDIPTELTSHHSAVIKNKKNEEGAKKKKGEVRNNVAIGSSFETHSCSVSIAGHEQQSEFGGAKRPECCGAPQVVSQSKKKRLEDQETGQF